MYETKRLLLRGFRPSDKDYFLNLFDNHNVIANLTDDYISPGYYTHSDMLDAMTKCALFVVVIEKSTRERMGFTLIQIAKPKHLDGDLGMALAEKWWGKGYGTEIIEWLKPYSFKTLGLRRLSLYVYSSNTQAIALYKKTGFEIEGRRREAVWKEGGWVDVIWMGVLATDDYAIKKRRAGTAPTN